MGDGAGVGDGVGEVANRRDGCQNNLGDLLRSTEGMQIIEQAVERRLPSAIRSYVLTTLLPPAAALIAVLSYAGIDAKSQLEKQRSDFARYESDQRTKLVDLESVVRRAGADVADLDRRVKNQLLDLQTSTLESKQASQANRAEISKEIDRVAALRTASHISKTEQERLEEKQQELLQNLREARREMSELRDISAAQGRIVAASVVEFLVLSSHDQSRVIQLPKRSGGDYLLQFKTSDVDKTVDLDVLVDGVPRPRLRVSNKDKGDWYPLVGTDGEYQFKVDQIYHVKGGKNPDFITLRVRSTQQYFPRIAQLPR